MDTTSTDTLSSSLRDLLAPAFVFDVQTLRIVSFTDSCSAVFRYDIDRFRGMYLSDMWPEEEFAWRSEMVRMVAESPRLDVGWSLAFNFKCGDGTVVNVQVSVVDLMVEGRKVVLALLERLARPVADED